MVPADSAGAEGGTVDIATQDKETIDQSTQVSSMNDNISLDCDFGMRVWY